MVSSFVDVSSYDTVDKNGNCTVPMDWSKQVANGAKLAFIKCSEYSEDNGFELQCKAVRKTNLILGAWHFFHPAVNAIKQADMQIALLKKVGLNWTGNPKTSDKIQLDLEVTDGQTYANVMKAAASWYYEVNKAFPNFEKDIYVGYGFWYNLLNSKVDGSWASNTKLWLPSYPLDPNPNYVVQPLPFNAQQVSDLVNNAYGKYAIKVPFPWTEITYRQITAWADSRYVPGHPGIKKVVDINATLVDFGQPVPPQPQPVPVPTPAPVPTPIPVPQPVLTHYKVKPSIAYIYPDWTETKKAFTSLPQNTVVVVVETNKLYSHINTLVSPVVNGWTATSNLVKI